MNWIIGINAVMAMVTIVFGIVALARPMLLSGVPAMRVPLLRRHVCARAIPFGAGLAYVLIVAVQQAVPWLVVAGAIQVLDAAIGCRRRAVGAVVHLGACISALDNRSARANGLLTCRFASIPITCVKFFLVRWATQA